MFGLKNVIRAAMPHAKFAYRHLGRTCGDNKVKFEISSVKMARCLPLPKYQRVTHVIFDMDGLLLDTERLYSEVVQKTLDKFGKKFTWKVKLSLMGMVTQDFCQRIVAIYDLPITWEEYSRLHKAEAVAVMGDVELMPGAERLLRHLHTNGVPIALATSSGVDMVELKTMHHKEVFELFHHMVCGSSDSEVKRGKPAPDIYLIAAARFCDNPKPRKCLVFEDAVNGVEAAYSAGMQCVMVPDERVPTEMRKNARVVLCSLLDFKPEEFGLPPFTDSLIPSEKQ